MSVDYISTDPSVEPQTRACARLLTAVVASAVQDMAIKPSSDEQRLCRNIDLTARHALSWVFEPSPVFVGYCQMIGADSTAMAEALLSDCKLGHGAAFTDLDRRIVQARHRWWMQERRTREHLALRDEAHTADVVLPGSVAGQG